ncbi:MAG: hypothetical protein EB072_19530, partial [Betaproteobacteria bacterium]|nr:hypothetical protein [Betaproteobacteria bacterium]
NLLGQTGQLGLCGQKLRLILCGFAKSPKVALRAFFTTLMPCTYKFIPQSEAIFRMPVMNCKICPQGQATESTIAHHRPAPGDYPAAPRTQHFYFGDMR